MKTYVLILSKHFPKHHPRSGDLTLFHYKLHHCEKLHTIRGNFELWAKRIDEVNQGKAIISIRQWSGKPYRSKQEEIHQLKAGQVGYEEIFISYIQGQFEITLNDDDYLYSDDIEELGNNDGLNGEQGLKDWFFPSLKKEECFTGIIIHFTDFRYRDFKHNNS